MFRILGSVDAINDKMGVNLTHHDVNWVYSCQNNKEARYYLKTRVSAIRLIPCLPETNKGMDKYFFIISGKVAQQTALPNQGWHTRWGGFRGNP